MNEKRNTSVQRAIATVPPSGREFHPLKSSAFHGALLRQSTRYEFFLFSFVVIVVVRGALPIVGGSGGGPINWLRWPVAILSVFVDVGFIQSGQQPVTDQENDDRNDEREDQCA